MTRSTHPATLKLLGLGVSVLILARNTRITYQAATSGCGAPCLCFRRGNLGRRAHLWARTLGANSLAATVLSAYCGYEELII